MLFCGSALRSAMLCELPDAAACCCPQHARDGITRGASNSCIWDTNLKLELHGDLIRCPRFPAIPLQIYCDETPFDELPSDYRCPQVGLLLLYCKALLQLGGQAAGLPW